MHGGTNGQKKHGGKLGANEEGFSGHLKFGRRSSSYSEWMMLLHPEIWDTEGSSV